MTDQGNGIWVSDLAISLASSVDTVIFDVDGVLLDVSQSFRRVTAMTVQYYLTEVLRWPGGGEYLAPADTELFKRAGGFNSDWALTNTATLLYLAKGIDAADKHAGVLRTVSPTLEEFTAVVGERGGGEENALAYLREVINDQTLNRALNAWDTTTLERVFCEFYAGRNHCAQVYGFDPYLVDFDRVGLLEGEMSHERVIIDTPALPSLLQYGIVTGRVRGELDMAMERTGLPTRIEPYAVMTADDGLHKPDPNGLIALADRMAPRAAIFVGDTLDDMRTVLNYRKVREIPPFLACQVLTGPAGERNRDFFAERGADIIAPDVNAAVRWLKGQLVV